MKTCRICTQSKPLDAYRSTRNACRECENARRREWYAAQSPSAHLTRPQCTKRTKTMHDKPILTQNRVLQLLMSRKEPISAVEIAKELGVMDKTAHYAIRELCIRGQAIVIGCRINKNKAKSKLYEWAGTTKATSKEPPKYTPWSGVDWSASTLRAGCLEHERIPSLRNGRRVQHRAPLAMCDGVRRA